MEIDPQGRSMLMLRILMAISLLGLGSCSYVFDVAATMIDGRLAFIVAPESKMRPRCVSLIYVSRAGRVSETAWSDAGGYGCDDQFPVFYGQALKGRLTSSQELSLKDGGLSPQEDTAAKTLMPGEVYSFLILAGGGGSGEGRFRIGPDGRVENLR